MRHNLYQGGNRRNLPWEPMIQSGNTHHTVRYAAHLPTKHRVLPFYFNQLDAGVQDYLEQVAPNGIVVNDSLAVHLLAAGTLVREIVVEIKRALPGVMLRVDLMGVAGDTNAQSVDDATDASTNDTSDQLNPGFGTAGSEAVSIISRTINASVAGYYRLPVVRRVGINQDYDANGVLLADEGVVTITPTVLPVDPQNPGNTPTLQNACFSVYTELVHFEDGNECPCPQEPCGAEYPTPEC